ncbi:regulatory protein RecX [Haliea sp. E17]|uniref:regulatory protein RecX n=1 Tax=Haliea sp. E17 TaxID=3401576 RepID=UPI003AAE1172
MHRRSSDNPVTLADVRIAAMDLLARREQSARELREKLARRFGTTPLLEEAIEGLRAENLQSDARFAGSFLRQRVSRGYGPLRIRQELRQRGIDNDTIEIVFAEENVDWRELAISALERKFGFRGSESVREDGDLREKARRIRFLQYRGFSHEHYSEVL